MSSNFSILFIDLGRTFLKREILEQKQLLLSVFLSFEPAFFFFKIIWRITFSC